MGVRESKRGPTDEIGSGAHLDTDETFLAGSQNAKSNNNYQVPQKKLVLLLVWTPFVAKNPIIGNALADLSGAAPSN